MKRMSNNSILVVGGGFAGITAALEAAEVGYEVYIVETNPYLGGRVAQLNQYFPKLCPPSCGLEIQFQRIKNNPKVKVLTMASVTSVSGSAGNYDVMITQRPRYVNERCTACGDCEKAASTTVSSEFDFGVGTRKVAYKTHPFMFPMRYVVDADNASDSELAAIRDACKYDAVDLDDAAKTVELKVGAIVVATGWKPYDVANLTNLGGGKLKNVVTNMQFERLAAPNGPTGGKILRPSDGVEPRKIAFVQCAGSRDQNHLNYCSYICCMASLKHVRYVRERSDANVTVFYIDLRTPGRYDKFKVMTEADDKLTLVKGKVAAIVQDAAGNPVVTVENAITGIKTEEKFDMVVLATGMQPSIAGLRVPAGAVDADGFVIDGDGIIAAGCAKQPFDVMKTAQSGTAAAMRAIKTVVGR
ncbi:MAG: CoB--CoM heterodisulfide reductase iron-sulfur subunit A family protein [Pseudodesulfovibrio sp.]|nr:MULTISPECIES: CoB--CoM heterodisulfide reductase iron-sulfur subunit A family protein [Pseudodesulfovibrio]MBU4380202.1 CoB--CoM heterodisulfide reductase iron-sulfur subunit A family protein [Pseudomonadota bacterium]MBU4475363.1 CoB--CoM heterodisulfide reductase iron-sulfur subunit A family protein [Pseudomonadota bacterium]MBU4517200.1 CoB--CoM heterodisulfide reductase iron-sulfur subunit A family protein [Pseudomonadota bacterium]MBU4521834.1 CoB--CoM heterodisulfide reductase iron-sul